MSVYAESGEEQDQIATNAGWGELVAWVEAADAGVELSHLCAHGWTDEPAALAAECRRATHADGVPADVRSVLESLAEFAARLPADAAVIVTNGMTADAPSEESPDGPA